jgi:phage baseplate assembly protein W
VTAPLQLPGVPPRRDLTFPFRVDPVSQQTAQSSYAAHVEQMVRQLLLTTPGERVNLPQFGSGLRSLVFSPLSDALSSTLKLQAVQSLQRFLAGVIVVGDVEVSSSADGGVLEPGSVVVTVSYTLVETQTSESLTVTIL